APAAQQLLPQDKHERLAIEDADALLAKPNQENGVERVNDDNVAKIEVCGHMLHDECLREWTEKANSCPICRQTFHTVTVYDKVGGKFATRAPERQFWPTPSTDAVWLQARLYRREKSRTRSRHPWYPTSICGNGPRSPPNSQRFPA